MGTGDNQGKTSGTTGNYLSTDGLAYPSNVLSLGKNREAVGHSAAYPVSLPEFFIKAYSDTGDIVFDPFTGSGSTLIAAEKEVRTFYGMEISPAYCDVIVQRWENFTGKKAERTNAE
jgi:DNA modification methylase